MDIVINYDPSKKEFNIYESSTNTLLVSVNLTEGIVSLDKFLKLSNLIPEESDILNSVDINYHLDSYTMKAMVESNVNLLKRLKSSQSEFKNSSNKFGSTNNFQLPNNKTKQQPQASGNFSRGSKNFSSGTFSGTSSSFGKSSGKFGKNK